MNSGVHHISPNIKNMFKEPLAFDHEHVIDLKDVPLH